ncbi:MAG: hypothetical protein R3C10_07760 [Pirellulales bacterium]
MTQSGSSMEYRRLRAPRHDRGILIEPALEQVGEVLRANAESQRSSTCQIGDRCIRELARSARQTTIAAALGYTAAYRDVPDVGADAAERLFMAGHQPQLFHPGVWFKNFVLDRLTRQYGGVAVNLVIDNDTAKAASIRVPGGSVRRPTASAVAFDTSSMPIPFEERDVHDWATFESFAQRVGDEIAPLVDDPMVRDFWPAVVERARATGRLGLALAQARHALEGRWGTETLEVPLSTVTDSAAFWWLAAHLLCELPRLFDVYNRTVLAYRRVNHIRSANHPVPLLERSGDWTEVPLWVWTDENPRRRHLFARRVGGELELGDRGKVAARVPLGSGGDWSATAAALGELGQRGIKVRPRALVTTLFARLFLTDMFMHGIGGSKYDELTDAILRDFFHVEPPIYATVSATLKLPIERPSVSSDDLADVVDALRQMRYHPERFLTDQHVAVSGPDAAAAEQIDEMIEEKRRWLAIEPNRENARQRCHGIRAANDALQPWLDAQRRELIERREELSAQLRAESILGSRDYAFCLFPRKKIEGFMLEFDSGTA